MKSQRIINIRLSRLIELSCDTETMRWFCWSRSTKIRELFLIKLTEKRVSIAWKSSETRPITRSILRGSMDEKIFNLNRSEASFFEERLRRNYKISLPRTQENWFHTSRVILNNSSIIQTSDRASTITRSFDLPLILLTKRVEVSRMHYFTNVSVLGSRIIVYRVSVRLVNHRCMCVCVLNKVEVWSSAIAARGSYVRPESLLGTPRQRLLNYRRSKAAYNTRTHSVSRLPPIPATIIFNPRRNWMRFELLKRLKSNYEYFSPV